MWLGAFRKAFEHFILMELLAYNAYRDLGFDIDFWRTKSGLEVDFILGKGEVAIEVKGTQRVDQRDLRPLTTFVEEYKPRKALVVTNEREERVRGALRLIPWQKFLKDLWGGRIIH